MSIRNFLKKISYNPFIVKAVRIFRLRGILRKFYYKYFCPDNGILNLRIGKIDAKFYVHTPDELRLAESVGGIRGEQKVINALVSHLSAGDVVYDVGANIGIYAVILAKAVGENGRIFAFEPEKNSVVRLRENIKINNLKNIEIINKALGENNAHGKLRMGKTTGNFSLIKIYEKEDDSQNVEIVNGDEYIINKKLPVPTAIKIDVEGYEYSVKSIPDFFQTA